LVTSSQDANSIAWYENDGSNNFARHIIDNAALMAKRAEIADLDDDGDQDVITAAFEDTEIAWQENDGDQNFTKHVIDANARGAYYVYPADIDDDGDTDVFSANRRENSVAWYENDGQEGFTKRIVDDNAIEVRMVIAADIDGDGHVDALAASVDDNTVAWHKNDGNGNFTKKVIDQTVIGAYGVFAIDIDFDGDIDTFSAGRNDGKVSLYTHIRAHSATVNMGGTLLIDSTLLLTVDATDGPADLTYTLTSAPEFGELWLAGVPVPEGGTFTQDDANNGRLTYMHDGVTDAADGFAFTVADGGEEGIQPASGTFSISVKAPISQPGIK
jgi:hypothetical protein